MGEWLKCDFHAHTTRSDGRDSPEAMVERYIREGFAAVSLTDHDILTNGELQQEYKDKILLIPGTEFTYSEPDRGMFGGMRHLLILFLSQMPESVEAAYGQGAGIYIAHPVTWPGAPRTFPEGVEGVESVNALYGVRGGWLGILLMVLERWRWRRWRQIGCSDAHSTDQVGTVYTMLRTERNLHGIRMALLSPPNKNRRIVVDWRKIREL